MGSASTKKGTSEVQHSELDKEKNNVKESRKDISVENHLSSEPTVAMAESKQEQMPTSPHLPLLSRTPEGALIPQALPVKEEVEGFETVYSLYNLFNDGFLVPFIHCPEYMLILDAREHGQFTESHIITARPHTAIDTDYDCLLEAGKLRRFTHIVLYDDHSTVTETSPVLQSLAERLRAQELDPVILIGGFLAFHAAYPFLCNKELIRNERDRSREIRTYPSEVLEGALYQGNAKHANSLEIITDLGITHIVNVTAECDNVFEGKCNYLQLKYADELGSNMKRRLPAAADFVAEALRKRGRVLIHCAQGISRSSTITLSFLMKYRAWSFADAMTFLKSKRPKARPNRAFLIQLGDLERDLFGKKISDADEIWMNLS
ncbi:dual specificity protein phosphatase 2-like [Acanthaster planci]|uniref:protein-tyrosine-phosphatase n=1 Tax=Acanthaster planci TaxID=133434 RepID=A0A8B7XG29_ACAPL|nr:dual specificity protein phosphatase 2-like [Acanthaster planci]XP_022079077.1 dual specificity protein phosphatase 2-like [Acanthaster planci]XP_022079087.1 dual specificity protein phosphatase 2-like [Acanthaster planci]XP_022079098.1 dual specificity protein phosphatase 2-like [Acanthaster planci]XP_022079108.1 dual specificity protein phosphatase 2-like [Acanthaster planci]XP_022112258.1 dual specificity protein phosphatase 2-like [Acanthaster planci]